MKYTRAAVCSILCLFSFCNYQNASENGVFMLTIEDNQLESALKEVVEEECNYSVCEKSAFIVKVKSSPKGCEIRIGALYKETMGAYMTDKKDQPLGFLRFEGHTVVVFGDLNGHLFKKTEKSEAFTFLEAWQEPIISQGEIPPPPINFEPIVWVYSYQNGILTLSDKGRFRLLT